MTQYDEYEEVPRHRKKTISKKKKVQKADHKHNYKKCIVSYDGEDVYGKRHHLYSIALYCTVCGKLDCNWFKTIEWDGGTDLPVFEVEMFDKRVNL